MPKSDHFPSILLSAIRTLAYRLPDDAFQALHDSLSWRGGRPGELDEFKLLSAAGEIMTATTAKTVCGDEFGYGDVFKVSSYPDGSEVISIPSYELILVRRKETKVGPATYVFDFDFEELRVLGRFAQDIDEGEPEHDNLRKSLVEYRMIPADMPQDEYAAWLVQHGWPNTTSA